MRILFLAHRIPYPPNKGEKIRSYNMLNYLRRRHEVHLATLIDESKDLGHVAHVSTLVANLIYDIIHPRLRMFISVLGFIRSRSISVSCFYSRKVQTGVDRLLKQYDFDAVICSSSQMADYLFRSRCPNEKLKRPMWLMDLMDVDSYKWRQYAEGSSGVRRWIYNRESKYLSRHEERILEEFDSVMLISEQEKNTLLKQVSADNVQAISNGVDLEYFNPSYGGKISKQGPVLVFTGVMDYRPNVEGVDWFVRNVFERIRRDFSNATFYIVGSHPSPRVERLRRFPGVHVTGFVQDIRAYLASADVCVVPLKMARGVQNKVLEAFAMGKAVVCTPEALEGINASPGRDVFVADDAAMFGSCVLRLLENVSLRKRLEINARQCVETSYSWEKNLAPLENLLEFRTWKNW
jgi:polysaccharide biosynthesis protein PslH